MHPHPTYTKTLSEVAARLDITKGMLITFCQRQHIRLKDGRIHCADINAVWLWQGTW